MRLARPALVLCLAAAAATVQAGTVAVSFSNETRFADAGGVGWEQEQNLKTLAHHLQSLGERLLPAEQTLRIQITDVDLAGEPRPSFRRGGDLRIVRGRADFPRIAMRYTLESNGRVLKSGEEAVTDLDYVNYTGVHGTREPLSYEKRMLERWFRERLLTPGGG